MHKAKPQSLKRKNRAALAAILVVNLGAFVAVLHGSDAAAALGLVPFGIFEKLLPIGGLGLIAAMLNSQLSPTAKARIVFLRWSHPLPGCRAFSSYVSSDARIDSRALARRVGPFPSVPADQNALWYKLYRSVADEPAVSEAQQQFLLWRDYTTMTVLLALILVPAAAVFSREAVPTLTLLAFLALQFGLAMQAARVQAERFVCSVLALNGTMDGRSE